MDNYLKYRNHELNQTSNVIEENDEFNILEVHTDYEDDEVSWSNQIIKRTKENLLISIEETLGFLDGSIEVIKKIRNDDLGTVNVEFTSKYGKTIYFNFRLNLDIWSCFIPDEKTENIFNEIRLDLFKNPTDLTEIYKKVREIDYYVFHISDTEWQEYHKWVIEEIEKIEDSKLKKYLFNLIKRNGFI